MSVGVTKLGDTFFAEIRGVDIARPISDEDFSAISAAFAEHAVLLFRQPGLTDDQQLAFTERFGELEYGTLRVGKQRNNAVDPRIADLSNVDDDGNLLPITHEKTLFQRANQLWHTDSSFKEIPASISILHSRAIPDTGGDTEFADLRAAWDALPEAKQKLMEPLVVFHNLLHSRRILGYDDFSEAELEKWQPVKQALVRTHPVTGRKNYFLASHAFAIDGWDETLGADLLAELSEFATQPQFVYTHKWSLGDMLMWDNKCTLHRGRPYPEAEQPRILRRTTVAGTTPTVIDGCPVNEAALAKAA